MLIRSMPLGTTIDIDGVDTFRVCERLGKKSARIISSRSGEFFLSVGDPYVVGRVELHLMKTTRNGVTIGIEASKDLTIRVYKLVEESLNED